MKASSGNIMGSDSESVESVPASSAERSNHKARNSVILSQDESQNSLPLAYLVSQKLILIGMGWMYFLAFYGAYRQNEGLMGSKGLVPSKEWFDKVQVSYKCPSTETTLERLWNPHCRKGFVDYPSLFWWFDLSDENTSTLLLVGMTISAFCVFGRSSSTAIWLFLWILYFSVVTSAGGTSFYQYGWESQVLETGFLCAFLCQNWLWPIDMTWNSTRATQHSSSPLVLWLFRWLSFRISIGAGMIKIRGDSCWTQKTCLLYHFETQPIPSPLSFVFHFLPEWMLRRAVDLDLFVQVYTSWFVLLPTLRVVRWKFLRRLAGMSLLLVRIGGLIQTGFMANIALSGNMSMLNHLTILPALASLDDACYPLWLRNFILDRFFGKPSRQSQHQAAYFWKWSSPRVWIHGVLFAGILFLSIPVVENLLELGGTRQIMNTSFGSFRLVNSYGAFGSVGKQRYEPIISIAYGAEEDSPQSQLEWIEIEFPCKPGSLNRRPCFCAPYHYRLDWNIWFIGFKPHSNYLNRRETWLYHLLEKILEENPQDSHTNTVTGIDHWWGKMNQQRLCPWLDLLDDTSRAMLEQRGSPLYAKVDMYRYKMAAPLWVLLPKYLRGLLEMKYDGKTGSTNVQWWNRYYEEPLLPAIAFDHQRGGLAWANL